MEPIETERLVLRNFTPGDEQALSQTITRYQATEYARYDRPWPSTSDEIKSIVEWFAGGDDFLAVELKNGGSFIGLLALNPEEENCPQAFNLGFIFDTRYHRRGYAGEACRAVLERAFAYLQAARVVSGTAAANLPACRLLEKLGFHKTVEYTVSFRTTAASQAGEFLGLHYTIEKKDWEKARPST